MRCPQEGCMCQIFKVIAYGDDFELLKCQACGMVFRKEVGDGTLLRQLPRQDGEGGETSS